MAALSPGVIGTAVLLLVLGGLADHAVLDSEIVMSVALVVGATLILAPIGIYLKQPEHYAGYFEDLSTQMNELITAAERKMLRDGDTREEVLNRPEQLPSK